MEAIERVALSRKADVAGDNNRQAWKAQKKSLNSCGRLEERFLTNSKKKWWLFDSSQSIHGLQTIVAAAIKKVHP